MAFATPMLPKLRQELAVLDRDGFGPGLGLVDGVDFAVTVDGVGGFYAR